jgi:low affinity Fe/Cu permease
MAKPRTPRPASPFSRLARSLARATGEPVTSAVATAIVLVWALSGPIFNFSDTWQLFINTGTTVATFLMVFVIQNSQNTDSAAVQLKLDELIRAVSAAKNSRLSVENLDQKDLDGIREEYQEMANQARQSEAAARKDSGGPRRGRKSRQNSNSRR